MRSRARAAITLAEVNGRALVTGGAGFIGSHLADLLLEQDWEVYALDDLSTGSDRNLFHLKENPHLHLTVESVLSASVVSELVHKEIYGQGIEEMYQRIPSVEKVRAAIGWEPTVDLESILEGFISHLSASSPPPETARVLP